MSASKVDNITQVCSRPSPPVAIAAIIAIESIVALAVSFYAARRLTRPRCASISYEKDLK